MAHTLTATEHAATMADYIAEGNRLAHALGNRGPIKLDDDGNLTSDILEAYWQHGFYVFEAVIGPDELAELRADVQNVLDRAPVAEGGSHDHQGRAAMGLEFELPSYRFAKPLSDPLGGTAKNKGRHPVKLVEPTPAADAPGSIVQNLLGNLQLMDSCLRLYAHPGLLAAAASILGADFVPYNEVTFVKEPGLGPAVAWHRDGTTHWDAADWNHGAHGFNFMSQLYPSTAGNCVWVLPGSHKLKHVDIKQHMAESGSERLKGAVPMLCEAGDVFMTNRQLVHGSFANTSPDRRITLNAGFFPRARILDVTTARLHGTVETFDADRIFERSRMIAVAADARQQRFPEEERYLYQPMLGHEDDNRWNEDTRRSVVQNYNLRDMYI